MCMCVLGKNKIVAKGNGIGHFVGQILLLSYTYMHVVHWLAISFDCAISPFMSIKNMTEAVRST